MPPSAPRSIYRLTGADRATFLQGLVSNDVRRVVDGPVYAAFLTAQGKYLADFLLVADGDAILLDVAASHGPALAARLGMYRLRADVQIALTDMQVQRGLGTAPAGAVMDPRHPALGWRFYGAEGGDDGTDWDAPRVAHVIPETGIELTPETYILEAGFDRLHGVDFRKGCYVGQEVTARMRHKTELKKGLVQLAIDGAAPIGTEITLDSKPAGVLYTQSKGRALAQMRFDRIAPGLMAGTARLGPVAN